MDIAGEGGYVIMTWDGLVYCGISGVGLVHSGLGGMSSRGDSNGRFTGSGAFPMSSGSVALGKMTDGLVAGLVAGLRSRDTSSGVGKEE